MSAREYLKKTALLEQSLATIDSLVSTLDLSLVAAKKELWNFYKDNADKLSASFIVNHLQNSKLVCQVIDCKRLGALIQLLGKNTIVDVILYAIRSKEQGVIKSEEIMDGDSMTKTFFISCVEERKREIKFEEPTPTPTLTPSNSFSQQKQKSQEFNDNRPKDLKRGPSLEGKPSQPEKSLTRKESQCENKENVPEKKASQPANMFKPALESQKSKEKEKNLKRKAPGEEVKKAEPEDNQMKRTKTQTGNKKQLDADPEINDPFYKSNKVTQQTTESADPDEECVFGEKIYERLKDVTLTDSSDDEKKQPKNQPKKNVSRKETRESFQTKPSFESKASSESFPDRVEAENAAPKMVKKTRKVVKVVEFRDARGYLQKKETTEFEEYWEEEKPKPMLNTGAMNNKSKAPAMRDKNQSALTSFFKKP